MATITYTFNGKANKRAFHLHVSTNLLDEYRWALYLYFPNREDYFSDFNRPILTSEKSTLNQLEQYLEDYNGFDGW